MNPRVFKRRIYISGLIVLVISVLFAIKLFTLHFSGKIIITDGYDPEIRRGYIMDRNRDILAVSIDTKSLYANPEEVRNIDDVASVLSPLLDISFVRIKRILSKKKRFVWLKRKLNEREVRAIRKLQIRGLHFKNEYKRVYPYGNLASNLIGFVGVDNRGLEGIEYGRDRELRGVGKKGRGYNRGERHSGYNIILSIDRFVQHTAWKEIEKVVKKHRAKQGVALVMEVKTGKILALAKTPAIDPNYYYRYPEFARRSFTVIDSFEPGSTLKIISAAAMLETGRSIANEKFICKGKIKIFDETINCTGVHGEVDLYKSIRYSCNVGIIEAMKRVKRKKFFDVLSRFGFGQRTGVQLPGESEGLLRPPDKWSGLSKYSVSIGHEISVTSIQMAAAFSAIANGGIYTAPSIVDAVEDPDGNKIFEQRPKIKGRVLKKSIASQLLKMMKDVVDKGTGVRAYSKIYGFAGKTGTSRKYSIRGGRYSDHVISSFIGIAPYDSPEICVYIVIDDPADKQYGGKIAAPIFKAIVEKILPVLGIKKSMAAPGKIIPKRSLVKKIRGNLLPDLRGLRLPDVLRTLNEINKRFMIKYRIYGTGVVFSQVPEPGSRIEKNQIIKIYFRGKK